MGTFLSDGTWVSEVPGSTPEPAFDQDAPLLAAVRAVDAARIEVEESTDSDEMDPVFDARDAADAAGRALRQLVLDLHQFEVLPSTKGGLFVACTTCGIEVGDIRSTDTLYTLASTALAHTHSMEKTMQIEAPTAAGSGS